MAQTMQSIPNALVETAKTQHAASSSGSVCSEEPEDNISLMLAACNSLNHLCILLEKLDHVMKMKNMELQSSLKEKEQKK